jgi:hypothetical protein
MLSLPLKAIIFRIFKVNKVYQRVQIQKIVLEAFKWAQNLP